MCTPVAAEQQTSSLTRNLRVGERVSFDNGRVVVTLEAKSGQQARLNFRVDKQVQVDKPPKDPPR